MSLSCLCSLTNRHRAGPPHMLVELKACSEQPCAPCFWWNTCLNPQGEQLPDQPVVGIIQAGFLEKTPKLGLKG